MAASAAGARRSYQAAKPTVAPPSSRCCRCGFGVPGYLGPVVVVTLGYALFQTANNTLVMAGASPDQRGVVSGLLNLSRNLGLVTGVSVMGAIFSVASGADDVANASRAGVATDMRVTFAVAALLVACTAAVAVLRSRTVASRIGRSATANSRQDN